MLANVMSRAGLPSVRRTRTDSSKAREGATEAQKGFGYLYEEKLRELELFSLEKGQVGVA